MRKIKKIAAAAMRAFGPAGTAVGAMTGAFGSLQMVFGGTGIGPLSPVDLVLVGLSIFAVCGAIVVIRHEWLLREVDDYLGNEHRRALWSDGIPATLESYLQYVRDGDYATVNRFWKSGLFNVTGLSGKTDLHMACEGGHALIAEEIIRQGCNPRIPDRQGHTPLMIAAVGGHSKVVEKLLQHDCAINARSSHNGSSALFLAVCNGHSEIVSMLLKERATVDSMDHNNMTPLIAAIARRHWDIAEQLLRSGADAHKIDTAGATLMDYALAYEAPTELIDNLSRRGIKPAQPSLRLASSGHGSYGHISIKWEKSESPDGEN